MELVRTVSEGLLLTHSLVEFLIVGNVLPWDHWHWMIAPFYPLVLHNHTTVAKKRSNVEYY